MIMMKKSLPSDFLSFASREEWRNWLAENATQSKGQWVLIFKKNAPAVGLRLHDAVEEALCFGWIDGLLKSVDNEKYLLKIGPRQKGSVWSANNKKRAERLVAEEKMTDAGLAQIKEAKQNGQWDAAYSSKEPAEIPADLTTALEKDPEALQNFGAFSNSMQFQYVYWINSAKTDATRQKRIAEVVLRARLKKKPSEKL